jgi:hypothetical protein
MTVVGYILYLLLISFHEVIFKDATSIAGVTINLPAIIVFSIALHKSDTAAAWFAFVAAIVMCAGTPLVMGWNALIMVAVSLILFTAREQLNLDSMVTKLFLLIAGVFIHNLVSIAVTQPADYLYQVWRFGLTGTLYTAAVAYLVYALIFGRTSRRRIRPYF